MNLNLEPFRINTPEAWRLALRRARAGDPDLLALQVKQCLDSLPRAMWSELANCVASPTPRRKKRGIGRRVPDVLVDYIRRCYVLNTTERKPPMPKTAVQEALASFAKTSKGTIRDIIAGRGVYAKSAEKSAAISATNRKR